MTLQASFLEWLGEIFGIDLIAIKVSNHYRKIIVSICSVLDIADVDITRVR